MTAHPTIPFWANSLDLHISFFETSTQPATFLVPLRVVVLVVVLLCLKPQPYHDQIGEDESVLLRLKEDHDGVEPSWNSVAAINLARLASMFIGTIVCFP
ncbi:hypothetical protein Tco_1128540 [Tanacetum coccineum]